MTSFGIQLALKKILELLREDATWKIKSIIMNMENQEKKKGTKKWMELISRNAIFGF